MGRTIGDASPGRLWLVLFRVMHWADLFVHPSLGAGASGVRCRGSIAALVGVDTVAKMCPSLSFPS